VQKIKTFKNSTPFQKFELKVYIVWGAFSCFQINKLEFVQMQILGIVKLYFSCSLIFDLILKLYSDSSH